MGSEGVSGQDEVEAALLERPVDRVREACLPHEQVGAHREDGRREPRDEHEREREAAAEPARAHGKARLHRLGGVEAVADAAHRLDRLGLLRVVLHLRAEPLHGDVDEPGVAEVVVVPDALE